ncbi:hypothetical protein ACIA48_16220 [Mycobacterium sp. NPDC051804]|uniref:hypothetical protein n=1 Tax=Mycobacterium sp. NPDC051804 TaxID=3364295 RepID=UPI00379F3BEB
MAATPAVAVRRAAGSTAAAEWAAQAANQVVAAADTAAAAVDSEVAAAAAGIAAAAAVGPRVGQVTVHHLAAATRVAQSRPQVGAS